MSGITVPSISPHTIRHTTAMHLLQSGVDLSVIAMWLGHETTQTTHQYLDADLETKKRALACLKPCMSKHWHNAAKAVRARVSEVPRIYRLIVPAIAQVAEHGRVDGVVQSMHRAVAEGHVEAAGMGTSKCPTDRKPWGVLNRHIDVVGRRSAVSCDILVVADGGSFVVAEVCAVVELSGQRDFSPSRQVLLTPSVMSAALIMLPQNMTPLDLRPMAVERASLLCRPSCSRRHR